MAFQDVDFDQILLKVIPLDGIRRIIEEPARLGEIDIERGLVDILLADTGKADALPLLAFTLRSLWDKGHNDRILKIKDYQASGGLRGSLATVADNVFDKALDKWEAQIIRRIFLKFVRVTDDGKYIRRTVSWGDLPVEAPDMLKDFIDNRLLISRGDGSLEVAHEALFSSWERFRGWLDESKADLLLYQMLRRAAQYWKENEYSQDYLWRGNRLAQVRDLWDRGQIPFDDVERKFLTESEAEVKKSLEKQQQIQEYESVKNKALSEYVHPYLLERRNKLQEDYVQEEEERQPKPGKLDWVKSLRMTSTEMYEIKREINEIENFLEKGRWHPEKPVHIDTAGAAHDYALIYEFPCCKKQVAGGQEPSQFREDGCQAPPEY
jgi:hypothetical protein